MISTDVHSNFFHSYINKPVHRENLEVEIQKENNG
jgi:hypothetical protein